MPYIDMYHPPSGEHWERQEHWLTWWVDSGRRVRKSQNMSGSWEHEGRGGEGRGGEGREIIMFSGRTFCNTTLSNANTVDEVYKYPKKGGTTEVYVLLIL